VGTARARARAAPPRVYGDPPRHALQAYRFLGTFISEGVSGGPIVHRGLPHQDQEEDPPNASPEKCQVLGC
jgi:hypothetical protein